MKIKNLGILTLSTMIGLGTFANSTLAFTPDQFEQPEQMIKVLSLDAESVNKADLVERFKKMFPGQFDFLEDRDFDMDQYHYPEWEQSDVKRVSLRFHKLRDNNKYSYGYLEFAGDELEVQQFYSQPMDTKDAMYPPKVSQEEAKEIATAFVSNLKGNESYRIREGQGPRYYWRNRTLTEPVEYEFHFEKLVNGLPVLNQGINVTVLGNGEITQYYGGQYFKDPLTYESNENTLNKDEVMKTIQETLDVELRYIIQHPYSGVSAKAELVYVPKPYFEGVNAKDGKWLVGQEFINGPLEDTKLEMLKSSVATEPRVVTKEEVRELADKLLPKETPAGKLHIDGVYEEEFGGIEVYSVRYTYRTSHGSSGTSISVNKQTGEIIHFYDMTRDYETQPTINLTYDEALKKAIHHLETFAPISMNEYAYPKDYQYKKPQGGGYSFHFPLVKNGVVVNGVGLYLSISAEDGRLISFNNHTIDIDEWPAVDQAVSEEYALEAFKEELDITLMYQNIYGNNNDNHYYLVYTPEFKDLFAYYNAILGEWSKTDEQVAPGTLPKLAGHWAEDEINYLINSNILSVEDPDEFNPDDYVSKGTALEVLVKSIMYVDHYYYYDENRQSFENIEKEHSLYPVIERAVASGIIEANTPTFNLDEPVTRQELAYWYVRALGLENVAKHQEIYKLPFADNQSIKKEYRGHVAIANALGIFQGNSKNQFMPNNNASLAHLAVTNFRFAKQAAEFNIERY